MNEMALAMMMAARVPHTLQPQKFGAWEIQRRPLWGGAISDWADYTILTHPIKPDMGNMHRAGDDGMVQDVVMEDSILELRKHLPIWMAAYGDVLVTGLGLGCVVRGLLALPDVSHIDVVELDEDILRVVGAEFADNPRVTLHHGDATTCVFPPEKRWDFAWHDLWVDGDMPHLQVLHAMLFKKYRKQVRHQGAWAFPRFLKIRYAHKEFPLLGSPRVRRIAA